MSWARVFAKEFGGAAFSPSRNIAPAGILPDCSLSNELVSLLQYKNGFFAHAAAIHVYPVGTVGHGSIELVEWNRLETWKEDYNQSLTDLWCFAENIFGEQFAFVGERICQFDPETGEVEETARTLEEWAKQLIADPDYYAGYSIAVEWQRINSTLAVGSRLIPKIPFVCGGDFSVGNLYSLESVKGMRLRALIANEIADLPDGATISFSIDESDYPGESE